MTAFITATSHLTLDSLETPVELSRKLRRADDYIRLAVIAADNAIQQHIEYSECDSFRADRCGLILGSGFSTMQTNFEVLDDVVSGEQTSPTLFSHSVFNAAAGYIASTLGIKGPALTITDFSFPFFKALEQGCFALYDDRLESCLVLQVEIYSDLLSDGRKRLVHDSIPWQPGVVCLLLEKQKKSSATGLSLEHIEITHQSCAPEAFLIGRQELMVGNVGQTSYDPLGAALRFAQLFTDTDCESCSFSVKSDWGDVRLQLAQIFHELR